MGVLPSRAGALRLDHDRRPEVDHVDAEARVRVILADLVRDGTTAADLPRRLVERCGRVLPVSGAGLALMDDTDHPAGLVAASDGVAVALEDLQFTLGEGPCVDASRTGRPVLVPDLAAADPYLGAAGRWPAFTREALAAGAAAVFTFPLRIGAIRLGVLDLYRERPGGLDEAEVAEALDLASTATTVLLHAQARRGPDAGPGRLEPWSLPLAHDRAVVHQATGVVSVTAGTGLGEALLLLRARAYTEQRPLDEVAADVVAGRVRLGPGAAGEAT
ncbi:GAF domain protein [Kineococcus radiotolerans SRS30216 = ATCC BAA-149]|uniref:GAF domain protein n=1 Tax=Kineococcus radiotolerans (strain ATCC BAA-149 / DSM 14245 / SRS30216) TaxID=266940 RepID=A6W4H6_KINRD|nr:GAF domain protein [Kineococcus radiotolerans SRS30216 = ATCC BAA-149]